MKAQQISSSEDEVQKIEPQQVSSSDSEETKETRKQTKIDEPQQISSSDSDDKASPSKKDRKLSKKRKKVETIWSYSNKNMFLAHLVFK